VARVVLPRALLKQHRACRAAYTSPEWDEKEQALIYSDWAKTVERHIAMGQEGLDRLQWFVNHKLVPMTQAELDAIKKEHSNG